MQEPKKEETLGIGIGDSYHGSQPAEHISSIKRQQDLNLGVVGLKGVVAWSCGCPLLGWFSGCSFFRTFLPCLWVGHRLVFLTFVPPFLTMVGANTGWS